MSNSEQTPDPRPALSQGIEKTGSALGKIQTEDLNNPTPCEEYNVAALAEHILLVAERLGRIGNGEAWDDLPDVVEASPKNYVKLYKQKTEYLQSVWSDETNFQTTRVLPWGHVSGGEVLWPYVVEFVSHCWDLSAAIGADLEIAEDVAFGAFRASTFIPDEARLGPDAVFGAAIDVPEDASTLTRLAGNMGRDISRWSLPTT